MNKFAYIIMKSIIFEDIKMSQSHRKLVLLIVTMCFSLFFISCSNNHGMDDVVNTHNTLGKIKIEISGLFLSEYESRIDYDDQKGVKFFSELKYNREFNGKDYLMHYV